MQIESTVYTIKVDGATPQKWLSKGPRFTNCFPRGVGLRWWTLHITWLRPSTSFVPNRWRSLKRTFELASRFYHPKNKKLPGWVFSWILVSCLSRHVFGPNMNNHLGMPWKMAWKKIIRLLNDALLQRRTGSNQVYISYAVMTLCILGPLAHFSGGHPWWILEGPKPTLIPSPRSISPVSVFHGFRTDG